mgnify:FL=1
MYLIFNSEKQIFLPALKFIALRGFERANSQQFSNKTKETSRSPNISIFLISRIKDGSMEDTLIRNLKSKL